VRGRYRPVLHILAVIACVAHTNSALGDAGLSNASHATLEHTNTKRSSLACAPPRNTCLWERKPISF